jgi:hypothetical protein
MTSIWITRLLHLALLCNLATAKNEFTRLFERCTKEKNTFDCFKHRALEILDSAIHDNTVYRINDYISISRDPAAAAKNYYMSENDTHLSLDEKLDSKFYEYLSSRSLKFTIPGNAFEGLRAIKFIDFVTRLLNCTKISDNSIALNCYSWNSKF